MPPTGKIALDDDQRFALMKFRRSVHDVLKPYHDDQFLLRWLRARNWHPEAAEKMLRQSLQWRQEWEIDSLDSWEPPEAVNLYYTCGTCGYDRDGAPVVIVPFGGLDMIGILHSVSRQDMVRMAAKLLEHNLSLANETGARQIVVVFDMDGFNLRQYAWRPATEVVVSLLQMYEANYPEILKACYIINTPRIFSIAYSVVKKVLNEYTIGKIQIYKCDPKKWKKVLRENIDGDNLPKYYGGDLTDPDGNPKYTTKIQQGGKVPKSYYMKNFNETNDEDRQFVSTTIKRGGKLVLDYIVADEGSFLRWEFKTEGHDIRFGVTCRDESGNIYPAVRHRRVAAHQINESGVLSCQSPATYTVTFDNSYSLLRNKKLHYLVYVTQPLSDVNLDGIKPDEDENKNNGKENGTSPKNNERL